jgi:hypothetical protein
MLALASPASAHPDVDRGRARYEQADLDGALRAFARAESADDLSRSDLLELLESRVMVQIARGDQAAADQDLARIRSIDPDHEFGRDVPPDVVESFRALGSADALAVSADGLSDDGAVVLTARVTNDPTSLIREVRIHARTPGGEWETEVGERMQLDADDVEFWAEAVGPGGAVLATAGQPDDPMRITGGVTGRSTLPVLLDTDGPDDATATDDSDGASPLPWIVAGGVVAAGIVVALVLLTGGGGEHDTQPAFPTVGF